MVKLIVKLVVSSGGSGHQIITMTDHKVRCVACTFYEASKIWSTSNSRSCGIPSCRECIYSLSLDYEIRRYTNLFNLAGLSRPGAFQYDVIGDTGDDEVSTPTPPLLSTSPPCFMYTKKKEPRFRTLFAPLHSGLFLGCENDRRTYANKK